MFGTKLQHFLVLLVLCLLQSFVWASPDDFGVTYTAPNQVVYDDSSSQLLSLYYGNSPIQRYAIFSGLNPLSSSAVVTIQIWLQYPQNSDVTIRLYSPDGDFITLSNREGGSNTNVFYGTLFTDSAANSVATYSFSNNVVATPLKAEDPFTKFRGKDPNGPWKIWLSDCCLTYDGYLDRVILTIQDTNLVPTPLNAITFPLFGNYPISYNYGSPSLTVTSTASGFVNRLSNYATITLQIWMPHTYSGDCTVTLMSPSGTTIYITNRRGGSAANVFNGTYFTDSATNSVASYSFSSNNVASPLKPESPFSTFRGQNPNGDWKIVFSDMAKGDDGKLSEVILVFQDGCLYQNPCGSGTCVATGSTTYTCSCATGYSGDGCVDINECLTNNGGCSSNAACANTIGSRTCTCNAGYSGNGVTCPDINECSSKNGGCSSNAVCTNTVGSFTCSCKTGYSGNGVTCSDINECSSKNGGCSSNAKCTNTVGSFTCSCNTGYAGDGVTCTDIDECATGKSNCASGIAICTNTIGSFNCTCNDGYSGNGVICADINECEIGDGPCSVNGNCTNVIGSYLCSCQEGFEGDGDSCSDLNECLGQGGGNNCTENANCINTEASFDCECKVGFDGNGFISCNDINECSNNNGGCSSNATCTNTQGSFNCQCKDGYYGNGITCIDYDECSGQNGGSDCATGTSTCFNIPSSYYCQCNNGYFGNGTSCFDYNECLGQRSGNNCDSQATCANTQGSFLCSCNLGYFGSGSLCTLTAIPSLGEITSNSLSISWNPSDGATGYQVAIVDADWNLTSIEDLGSTNINYKFMNLLSNTQYRLRLFTQSSSNPSNDFRDISATTYPAQVTGIVIEQVTYNSITFLMKPSSGAISYSAQLFDQSNNLLSTRSLSISAINETTIRTTILQLNSNQNYKIKIFANPESVGTSFSFQTFPAPPSLIQYERLSQTSIGLNWQLSEGATQYRLIQTYSNGTLIDLNDFGNVSSTNVYNLESMVQYLFTFYSGNSNGFDLSEGRGVLVSTDKVQCLSIVEDNAYWPPTTGERTGGYCVEGYGGSPLRYCNDNGGPTGDFDEIISSCIQYPDPVSKVKVSARSDSATITWEIPARATYYKVYLVIQEMLLPINDGAGLNITTNEATIYSLQEFTDYTLLIYSGNYGGYETIGKMVDFQTPISPPTKLETEVGATWIYLSWDSSLMATSYSIVLFTPDKRGETELAQQTETNYNVTSLQSGKDYTITVYAIKDGIREPIGLSVSFKTNSAINEQNGSPPPDNPVNVTGIVVGVLMGVLFLVLLVVGAIMYKRYHDRKRRSESTELELKDLDSTNFEATSFRKSSSQIENAEDQTIKDPKNDTLMNTSLAISIPGFLLLDFGAQIRKEEKLGSGGAGCVFSGVLLDQELISQHRTDKIALKLVSKSSTLSEEDSKEIFLQEVSLMWSCSFHENVIKLIGYTLEPEHYIITKKYELDLFTFIHHPTEDLPPLIAMQLTNDIALGMASIQQLGIIHNDLKSANVLLDQIKHTSGGYILRGIICDFGLAKISTGSIAVDPKKQIHERTGLSPRYAAPEMFSKARTGFNSNHSDNMKSDVYSLGIIIWEMLTRQIVWAGLPNDDIEFQVRSGNRPPIPEFSEDEEVIILLIELMQKCWNKEPSERPSFNDITQRFNAK